MLAANSNRLLRMEACHRNMLSYKTHLRPHMANNKSDMTSMDRNLARTLVELVYKKAVKLSMKAVAVRRINKLKRQQNRRLIWKTLMFNLKMMETTVMKHHSQPVVKINLVKQQLETQSITKTNLTVEAVLKL